MQLTHSIEATTERIQKALEASKQTWEATMDHLSLINHARYGMPSERRAFSLIATHETFNA